MISIEAAPAIIDEVVTIDGEPFPTLRRAYN